MKRLGILLIVFGLVVVFGSLAYAVPVIDVVESPTGYFVDIDANKYDSPYYRGSAQDWSWQHTAISTSFTTATLSISAFDVDYVSHTPSIWPVGERDMIYARDGSDWVSLGYLAGGNDIWSYTTFSLGDQFDDEIASGLEVMMTIDGSGEGWIVTLAKSVLSLDEGTLPNPNPGAVPEPATFLLFGAGLAGVGLLKKKFMR